MGSEVLPNTGSGWLCNVIFVEIGKGGSENHGKGSTSACTFDVRKRFYILVSCLVCHLIQDPTFSLRADILLAASAGGRYIYASL